MQCGCGSISQRSAFLALLLLAYIPTTAQTGTHLRELPTAAEANSASDTQSFSANVREVNVIFSASDWRGHFVADLKPADVSVFDNGKQQDSITYFLREENLSLELGILIDVSGSVTGVFHAQQRAASLFLQQTLRASDRASLIAFGSEAHVVQDFTANVSQLTSQIERLRAGDTTTAIYDAVRSSCEKLARQKQSGPNRRALVLITDGEDNASQGELDGAIDAALQSDVVIFALNTNPSPELTDKNLRKLAEDTGGSLLHAAGQRALKSAFMKVNQQLRSQYLLGYKPTHLQTDRRFHRIHLAAHKFGLHIHCRKGYYLAD